MIDTPPRFADRAPSPRVAYVTHASALLHDMGDGHPERPDRVHAVHRGLVESGLLERMDRFDAGEASDEQILRVHTSAHLEHLRRSRPLCGTAWLDADTAMNEHTWTAAREAAGAVVMATGLVLEQGYDRAFCNVRPPGHHAESSSPMGFCFFNNIAVGARHAMTNHGVERVVIVDFDVHHGNGTEEIFCHDGRVLMVSTFQSPLYPGSGEEPLGPNMVNTPLPAGTDGAAMRRAVIDHWLPAIDEFRPDLFYISAGFDAHRDDPLAQLRWTEEDYAWITRQIVTLAKKSCRGRVVAVLEGGYSLKALSRSAASHVGALLEAH